MSPWQIPYEYLAEFSYLFRKLKFKFRTSKTVYNYFEWYYSIQNEFEKSLRFSEEEYEEIMQWLKKVTSDESIRRSDDVFSVAFQIKRFYKRMTPRSRFMGSDFLIERYLKWHPAEKYVSKYYF